MRILLSTDTVGGVWDHVVVLARELDAAGHEVLVAALGEPRDERLAALPPGVQVTWRDYRLEWMPDAEEDVAAAGGWLRGLAEAWEADVAHLNGLTQAAAGFSVPTLTVVHSDVLSWFAEARGAEAPAEWRGYAERVRLGLAASGLVAAPTAYQAALVRRHYGAGRVETVHNGVPLPPEREAPAGPPPTLLTVGRAWDAAKGVETLEVALERLGDGAPEARLLGPTEGPAGERFRPRRLRARGRVERAEVDRAMDAAGVYVAPSLYEPFGLAPLEAALRGCALLLSDCPSFRELWEGCALFFPRGDAEALAERIAEVTEDERLRARLAEAAGTRARRRYGAGRMARAYLDLYRRAAAPALATGGRG